MATQESSDVVRSQNSDCIIQNIETRINGISPNTVLYVKFHDFDDFVKAYRNDIVGGGVFIRSIENLQVGTKIKLEFVLSNNQHLINGEGVVVSSSGPSNHPGYIGIQFLNLAEKSKILLTKLTDL